MGDRDYMRSTDWIDRPRWGVLGIIIATVAAFFLEGAVVGAGGKRVIDQWFALTPADVVTHGRLWELLTHAFLHAPYDVSHIIVNMFCLYLFGPSIEAMYGTRRFLGLYACAALMGGLIYTAGGWFQHPHTPCVGASGAVMGVMVVAAFHDPRRPFWIFFIIRIPLGVLVGIYVLIDLYYTIAGVQTGIAHLGHLGGAFYGYLFYRFGGVPGARLSFRGLRRIDPRRLFRTDPRKIEAEVDAILEKISREGIQSLTPRERATLDKASRLRRDAGSSE